ncbi:RNA-dependent ATPase [Pseudocyphellaria aurata]|nr:RNA-dependent ATPase [Pseudocyphellaria aurata]
MGKRQVDNGDMTTESVNSGDFDGKIAKKRKLKRDEDPKSGDGDLGISKEDRKELKRAKKLKKERGFRNGKEEDITSNNKVEVLKEADPMEVEPGKDIEKEKEEVDKSAAKAARKADKARLKSAKKEETRSKKSGRNGVEPSTSNSIPQNATTAQTLGTNSATLSAYEEDPTLTNVPQSDIDAFLTTNFITINDPTSSTPLRPIINFSQLPKSCTKISPFTNFKTPTPIQSTAWPFLLSGRDVVGVAETGSGKTLAFGVPCIRSITTAFPKQPSKAAAKAVIVSPTRELAVQIHDQISQLASAAGLRSVVIYGGIPKEPQRLALPRAQIIVATPGRLNDLISEGVADLSAVTYLVLDEADRMLDTGFEPDIRKILACTPSTGARQTLMFTATWPPSVRALASSFMCDPVHISIGKDNPTGALRANTAITQQVEVIAPYDKEQRLLQLIKKYQSGSNVNDRILVFCLYKKEATRVEGFLRSRGLSVAGIHGDLSQERRSASLDAFRKGDCPLLVATDVAARGLDIPAVKLVLNMTFPLTVEDYVHRIGRTGRAGSTGLAITLFTEHDKSLSGALINVLKAANQPVPPELLKFGGTVKKKGHEAYGAFYKDVGGGGEGGEVKGSKDFRWKEDTNNADITEGHLQSHSTSSFLHGSAQKKKSRLILLCFRNFAQIPDTMRAVDIKGGAGHASALYINTIPKPKLQASDAIVKIKAFGLNRMDLLQREGHYPVPPGASRILGVEFSGVVESLGPEPERDFKVGDEVFGLAYGALHLIGGFERGKTVLWHAGASGVSIAGIQLSQLAGASAVYVTAGSDEKIDFCTRTLGATQGFNYRTQPDWAQGILAATGGKGVDIIVDFVGQSYFASNLNAAAADGRIVHLGLLSGAALPAGTSLAPFIRKRIRFEGSSLRARDVDYQRRLRDGVVEEALPGLRDGRLKLFTEKVFGWEDVAEAHRLMETNQTMGKIICTVE